MKNYRTFINPTELVGHLSDDVRIVDCRWYPFEKQRGYNEYLEGHIPGAVFADLDNDLSGQIIPGKTGRHPLPDLTEFIQLLRNWGIDNKTQVIVYDQAHGGIAARLWWLLNWLGHNRVAVLVQGWAGWNEKGFPESNEIPVFEKAQFEGNSQNDWIIDADAIQSRTDQIQLIDSRSHNRYLGNEEPIDPIAGHIPQALNRPFTDNLHEDWSLKSLEILEEEWTKFDKEKGNKERVFYCGSGVTACFNILINTYLGQPIPKLYPGSWSDWITDADRPIGQD